MKLLSPTIPPPVVGVVLMILSAVLDRLPDIHVPLAETNASSIPGLLYMIDDSYQIFRHWYCAHRRPGSRLNTPPPSSGNREHLLIPSHLPVTATNRN